MSPRRYDRRSRLAAAEETRRRIVRATVELHGQHGAMGTTHEMIARQAGVSIPTVYKYFPTRNDLIPHCTGLVMNEAPIQLDEKAFSGKTDVPARLHGLAHRVFQFYAYAAPWLRWSARDAADLPAVQRFLQTAAEARMSLLRAALAPGFDRKLPRRLMGLASVLLDFPSWESLTKSGFTTQSAADAVGDALAVLFVAARKEKES